MGGACQQHGDVISQITTKTVRVGASWCVLCRPLPPGPSLRGGTRGLCRGGDSPLGNWDPVSICVKIQTHHHFETRGPQSVSHHHDSGHGNPLPRPFFEQFFRGGFFGLYIKFVYFFESCWWLWFSLGSLWQQIDKRRGRAHPQVLKGMATKWSKPRPLPQWQQSAGRSLETVSDHHS